MRRNLRWSVVLLLCLFLVNPGWAGTGSYKDGSPDLIELRVLFDYDETSPQDWETLFKEASKLLYNATEKQVKIGKVIVYNHCTDAADKADVRIFNDHQGAEANVEGLGTPGAFIRLSQTHKTVTTSGSGDRGQLGLVHEMGHYVFGLLDEYLDKTGKKVASAYCIDTGGTTASIMDGGTTVPTKNQRHEFCWTSNHRVGQTNQDASRSIGSQTFEDKDSWTWLAAFVKEKYGATLAVPTADPADDVAGYGGDPQFEYHDCGLRSVVCIDRSGSMAASPLSRSLDGAGPYEGTRLALSAANLAPIDLAKQGAGNFIQLLKEADRAAVTSFSDTSSVDSPMKVMTAANKAAALAAIGTLQAGGSTNIGGGLQTSLDQIVQDGTPLASETIILLSDGQHNTGSHPDMVLPALKQRGVVVHTIGLGQVDAALMSRIAQETGGTYLYANTASELNSHYLTILSAMRSQGILKSKAEDLGAGQQVQFSVLVDSLTAAASADFLLVWNDPATEISFSLMRPDGSTVNPADPGVTFEYDAGRALKHYRIDHPQAGQWSAVIDNTSAGVGRIAFQVHSAATGFTLGGDAGKGVLTYPAPLRIRATVATDHPVAGASLAALVHRPNGAPVALSLFDDGSIAHGDARAKDGVYSALFHGLFGDGSYTVDLTADTAGASTVSPGENGGSFTPAPVERFVRQKSFSVVMQGVAAADGDLDGVRDIDEDVAPNSGDGNGDGVPDRDQSGVASFLRAADGGTSTLIAHTGCAQLTGVASGLPVPSDPNLQFPFGVVSFLLECGGGQVDLVFHGVPTLAGFGVYRYGPTSTDSNPHWYRFDFDGTTGAEILGNRVILHFVDGQRGDDDLVTNGVVVVDQVGVVRQIDISEVPTISPWGLALLGVGLAGAAFWSLRRTRRTGV